MLPKAHQPTDVEDRIYRIWEESGAFRADAGSSKEPFTIVMPLPNATGQLHLGHAVMLSLEDIFTRFNRMRGKEALWVPGTDHAAIATENVVIRKIQEEEGIADPRRTLGREKLLQRIIAFVAQSQDTIRGQIRKMGSSCDWSREAYTMDPPRCRMVHETFVRMYRDGLIYRGPRIVNWDPKLQTTLSDDEVTWEQERAPFFTFQYGPFRIGTARPETKFGDKYVVMHPDDERYSSYKHGDTFTCEWINGPITATVIKDPVVDPKFGTGVMTITPAHDAVDFEIAERHHLDKEQIIDVEGRLLPIAGEFAGLPIEEARPKIVEKLRRKSLLVEIDENYEHNVAKSSRGGGVVEPQIREQWFVDVNKRVVPWGKILGVFPRKMSLKEVMKDVVRTGKIRIVPDHFEKIYFHWIDNLRDWCISRQIWWGHRIPVWYCVGDDHCKPECKRPIVSLQTPKQCPHCGSANLEQDPDTLDTWFSSALWTWSTLIDPKLAVDPSVSFEEILKRSPDFRKFHPTQVMETGYDILFFWVARMILMTTYMIGDIPFETVYLHGMVRTREGKKMSKSDPETCIDPLESIEKHGADALRLSMIVGQGPGNDFRLYEEKIAGYRNFVNKLWNAARFILMQCEKEGVDPYGLQCGNAEMRKCGNASLADRALLSKLQTLIEDITQGLEDYRLSEVGERLYSFTWDFLCDWILELSKDSPRLRQARLPDGQGSGGQATLPVLVHAMRTILTLLHPYAPFVTEELWSSFKPVGSDMLLKSSWPQPDRALLDEEAEKHLQILIDIVSAIRKVRSDHGIDPAKTIDVIIHATEHLDVIRTVRDPISRLGRIRDWTLDSIPAKHDNVASVFLTGIEVHVSLEGVMDVRREKESLEKEKEELSTYVQSLAVRLQSAEFRKKAPTAVIAKEEERKREAQERLKKVEERLAAIA